MLFSLASIAMPARISGTATASMELREARTGVIAHIAPGKFTKTVAPGEYTITSGQTVSHHLLLAGGHYEIGDPRYPIDVVLAALPSTNGGVRISAQLTGSGKHNIELRAFNGTADRSSATVMLTPGRKQTVTWNLKIEVENKPWAIVAIPDNNMTARQELSGTLNQLSQIG